MARRMFSFAARRLGKIAACGTSQGGQHHHPGTQEPPMNRERSLADVLADPRVRLRAARHGRHPWVGDVLPGTPG